MEENLQGVKLDIQAHTERQKSQKSLKNLHLLVILYICLKQMLGNENIFNTIALLASSRSGSICDLIKKFRKVYISHPKENTRKEIMCLMEVLFLKFKNLYKSKLTSKL